MISSKLCLLLLLVADIIAAACGLQVKASPFRAPVLSNLEIEQSHNMSEWNIFTSKLQQFPFDEQANTGTPICVHDYVVPKVYLLGAQKAGSSTLAADLMIAGLRSADRVTKELHTFDRFCDFKTEPRRTDKDWDDFRHPGECKLAADDVAMWAGSFDKECWLGGEYADMTPLYLRLPGLPTAMAHVYGEEKANVKFIIGLREPLMRLHSGFYHEVSHNEKYVNFAEYVHMLREAAPDVHKNGSYALSHSYKFDQFYRSLYSLNIEPWLDTFNPKQFAIVPMAKYFGNVAERQNGIAQIGRHLGIRLYPKRITEADIKNQGQHPSLQEDLPRKMSEWLQDEYFIPDAKRLASLLAPAMKSGLVIVGYQGPPYSADIFKYLTQNW